MSNQYHRQLAQDLHSAAIQLLRYARLTDRQSELSSEKLSLLSVLTFAGAHTVTELARAEMVSVPAISRNLKSLESLGLVTRTRTESDQRQRLVEVTDQGRSVIMQARDLRCERIAELLVDCDSSELDQLKEAARLLTSRLRK